MIERLQYYPIKDKNGNCYGSNPPNISQIIDKINEIIDTINQKEEQHYADEHLNNPFINVPIHMSNNTYKIWLDKACKWLNDNFANANERLICYIGNSDMNVMVKHFRKYMNEQQ